MWQHTGSQIAEFAAVVILHQNLCSWADAIALDNDFTT
jgi:hypothetical protein